jgi:hypothetical protein
MAHRENPFYGITIKEIARVCHVDLTTARRWKRGARCPPKSAILLIQRDLVCFDPEWSGWHLKDGFLISPEGWQIGSGEVLAIPILRQQLAGYEVELRRIQGELLLTQEQPVPDVWPEWVFEKLA